MQHATAVATDLGHPHRIYIIPTHDKHQWLLIVFSTPDDGRRKRPKHVK
jgi:hypothetical protein